MIIETRLGDLVLNHCQQNQDGFFFNDDVKRAVQAQIPDLLTHITFDDVIWVHPSAVKKVVTAYDKTLDNQVKAKRLKDIEKLDAESKKLICCFSNTFLGKTFDLGISHQTPVNHKTTLKSVLVLLDDAIDNPEISLKERDYLSSCRYMLIASRKAMNASLYVANKLGIKEEHETNELH